MGVRSGGVNGYGGEVLDGVEPETIRIQLLGKPHHPCPRLIAHVLATTTATMLGIAVANVGTAKNLTANIAAGTLMTAVGMKVVAAFGPAAGLCARKTLVFELLEFIARSIGVFGTAIHVVEHNVWINLKPVGMGNGDQAKELVLGSELGSDGTSLILIAEIVMIERIIPMEKPPLAPLAGDGIHIPSIPNWRRRGASFAR
jgi:hypothetical protein